MQSYYHYLINRYFNNTITRQELDELLALAQSGEYDDELTAALLQQWEAGDEKKEAGIDWDSKLETMLQQYRSPAVKVPVIRSIKWYRIAAAAVLLLMLGAGVYFTMRPKPNKTAVISNDNISSAETAVLQPGTNGAVLTLGDGKQIVLDSAGNGLLAMQGNTVVVNNNGSIMYNDATGDTKETIYNTLKTPRGKQYRLELPDGTRVWLNAASSIRFPTSFSNDIRRVEITGEAYFEVAHIDRKSNSPLPFVVAFSSPTGASGEVQVLGTHFNVNAYEDEESTKVTLLEGSVKVAAVGNRQSAILKPGEQSVFIADSRFTIHEVDVEPAVAWKNGYFSFSETDMATLMRQIARWYDVEIEYAGPIPDRKFGGEISRNSNAEQVLKIMEESEVHFKIAGRKIIVLP